MKTLILIVGVGLLFSTSVMSASAETSPLAVTERVESNIDCVEEYRVEQWNGDCLEGSSQYWCEAEGRVAYCNIDDRICDDGFEIIYEVTFEECNVQ